VDRYLHDDNVVAFEETLRHKAQLFPHAEVFPEQRPNRIVAARRPPSFQPR
jgi:hypothetical protein